MNKKLIVIFFCMLMLAAIPLAAGQTNDTKKEINSPGEPQGFLGKTYVRGFIFGYHHEGLMTSFFAIFCHYKTIYLIRPPVSGYYMMENIQFLGKINGHIGMFYINGFFHGTPF